MKAIYNDYKSYQYGIEGMGKIATQFHPLEKACKISYRVIDLTDILITKLTMPFLLLSSQIKDLVLMIESTRFFCVSFPLFFRDKMGRSFFQVKTKVQCAEKISITAHLALKTLFGADRVGLIRLGIVGSYAVGNLTLFRWVIEGSILGYNFFGSCDGAQTVAYARSGLQSFHDRIYQMTSSDTHSTIRKWEVVKSGLEFDLAKGWWKIAATVSKLIMISFATTMAAINIWTVPCQAIILSLGIISDGIGLLAYFHQEYCVP